MHAREIKIFMQKNFVSKEPFLVWRLWMIEYFIFEGPQLAWGREKKMASKSGFMCPKCIHKHTMRIKSLLKNQFLLAIPKKWPRDIFFPLNRIKIFWWKFSKMLPQNSWDGIKTLTNNVESRESLMSISRKECPLKCPLLRFSCVRKKIIFQKLQQAAAAVALVTFYVSNPFLCVSVCMYFIWRHQEESQCDIRKSK
jgi:hypothetical protein